MEPTLYLVVVYKREEYDNVVVNQQCFDNIQDAARKFVELHKNLPEDQYVEAYEVLGRNVTYVPHDRLLREFANEFF